MRDTKVIYVLNVGGNYAPEITALTYPLIHAYAHKIGAEWVEIKERKFPEWPVTYEKLQIHELAKENGADWHIYFDADTLIHPQMFDVTTQIPRDTVAHNAVDMAGQRWRYDEYFLRDGRNIGSNNWCAVASKLCLDLWRPLDITPGEAIANIFPTVGELNGGMGPEHLIDDYALSRNIARFGLKYTTLVDVCIKNKLAVKAPTGFDCVPFFFHNYNIPEELKISQMQEALKNWGIMR